MDGGSAEFAWSKILPPLRTANAPGIVAAFPKSLWVSATLRKPDHQVGLFYVIWKGRRTRSTSTMDGANAEFAGAKLCLPYGQPTEGSACGAMLPALLLYSPHPC